jgi:hypothetical protein
MRWPLAFIPLTVAGWKKILGECGYTITNLDSGPMRVLNPLSMLQDEGPAGVARITRNLATHKGLRERVMSTKAVIESHTDTSGYFAIMIMNEYANRPGSE